MSVDFNDLPIEEQKKYINKPSHDEMLALERLAAERIRLENILFERKVEAVLARNGLITLPTDDEALSLPRPANRNSE